MSTVEADGVRLHCAVAGDGPRAPGGAASGGAGNVVFVHGAGGNAEQWRAQLAALPLGWHGLALDLPGHGGSGGPGRRTIPQYRDVVRGVLRAAGAAPAVLVGHSMGGAITQAVALAEPDLLRGIVLVGTGARLRVHPSLFEALRRDHAEAARLLVQWGYGPMASEALRAETQRDLLSCPPAVLEGDFRACDAFDVMAEMARIRLPALVVCGEQDALTPPKYARYLHQAIPESRLALVPEAGHFVMQEQRDAVISALADFLEALPPDR